MLLIAMLKQHWSVCIRHRNNWLCPLLFYGLVCILFLLSVPPDQPLQSFAPSILWMAFLLSTLMSLEALFRYDFEQGCLEQVLLSPIPLWQWVIYKIIVNWLLSVPLFLLTLPLLATMLALPSSALATLVLSVFIGSLGLHFIGAIGSALIVSLPTAGLLLALVILPFYIPILIFAVAAVNSTLMDNNALIWLTGLSLFAMTSAPFAVAAILHLMLSATQ